MSHFVALVVGDVDYNLAPFHEFECTGMNNEFVLEIDETEEARSNYECNKNDYGYSSFADFVGSYYGYKSVSAGDRPDLSSDELHKYGYVLLDEAGEVAKVVKRTNPNSKWDWYVEGGRWTGYLLTKDGRRVNSAKKGEIDFEKMRKEADDRCRRVYQETSYEPSLTWRSWQDVMADECITEKREFYWAQPDLVLVKERHKAAVSDPHTLFFFSYDDLLGRTADEYVDAISDRGITPYAMVKDREWAARGEMGWFGMSSDDVDQKSWAGQVWEAIQTLPDDAVLTAVDCHI